MTPDELLKLSVALASPTRWHDLRDEECDAAAAYLRAQAEAVDSEGCPACVTCGTPRTDPDYEHSEAALRAQAEAADRMGSLYAAVSRCIEEDRCVNLTRLHDYTGGEEIPADAIVGDVIDEQAEEAQPVGTIKFYGNGFNHVPVVVWNGPHPVECDAVVYAHPPAAQPAPSGTVTVAPWTDHLEQPIRHGDILVHPQDGVEFVAVRMPMAHLTDEDAWRAIYYDGQNVSVSRLVLQIGDKGRAVLAVAPPAPAQPVAQGVTDERRFKLPESVALAAHDLMAAIECAIEDTANAHPPAQQAPSAEALALRFHETYERLAPSFGYETRTETRAFDKGTPNGRLMIAVCSELLTFLADAPPAPAQPVALTAELVRNLIAETREVFDAEGRETPQVVRDVIEYVSSYLDVYLDKRTSAAHPPAAQPLTDERIFDLWREHFKLPIYDGKPIDGANNPVLKFARAVLAAWVQK